MWKVVAKPGDLIFSDEEGDFYYSNFIEVLETEDMRLSLTYNLEDTPYLGVLITTKVYVEENTKLELKERAQVDPQSARLMAFQRADWLRNMWKLARRSIDDMHLTEDEVADLDL